MSTILGGKVKKTRRRGRPTKLMAVAKSLDEALVGIAARSSEDLNTMYDIIRNIAVDPMSSETRKLTSATFIISLADKFDQKFKSLEEKEIEELEKIESAGGDPEDEEDNSFAAQFNRVATANNRSIQ